nr:hypothetical protein [Tanacetum cinerariifolium]
MLTDEIKQSSAYKAFIAYSTGSIHPKKTRGKGLQGKKQTIIPKKKSFIFVDDNIIPEPDVALELGQSISKTRADIAEEERHLHEIHERLVTPKPTGVDESDESNGEPANRPTGRKSLSGVAFRDTLNVSKKKSLDRSQKLKDYNNKPENQVKELVLHQMFSMSSQANSQPRLKELVLYQSPKGLSSGLNTIKDDDVIQRLKFVNKVTPKPTGVDESDESNGEPANRPTGRKSLSGVAFRDTLNVSKKKSLDRSQKLKAEIWLGALLHNTTAQDTGERPLNVV